MLENRYGCLLELQRMNIIPHEAARVCNLVHYISTPHRVLYLAEKNRLTRIAPRWNNIRGIIVADDRFLSDIVMGRYKYFHMVNRAAKIGKNNKNFQFPSDAISQRREQSNLSLC